MKNKLCPYVSMQYRTLKEHHQLPETAASVKTRMPRLREIYVFLYFSAVDNASLQRVNEMGHVLDSLLINYDKRVRPDVGGETGDGS